MRHDYIVQFELCFIFIPREKSFAQRIVNTLWGGVSSAIDLTPSLSLPELPNENPYVIVS